MNALDQLTVQFSTTQWFIDPPHSWWPPKGLWDIAKVRWANKSSWMIRKGCHSVFSHMDFVLDDGSLLGSSNMGIGSPVIKGNPCGVAIRPPDYQKPWGLRRRMILNTDRADDIIAMALTQLGKPFDNSAIFTFMSKWTPRPARNWHIDDAWFCAEYCTWAEETGGYWKRRLIWPKDRVSPTDNLLLFVTDPHFVNYETFWDPIPGLKLDPGER